RAEERHRFLRRAGRVHIESVHAQHRYFAASAAWRFASSAASTRSGENGIWRRRIPTASQIAFAIAGMIGWSGPSPASFAPYGPPGSMLSTIEAMISGVSTLVGIR